MCRLRTVIIGCFNKKIKCCRSYNAQPFYSCNIFFTHIYYALLKLL